VLRILKVAAVVMAISAMGAAQSEMRLREYFEGRTVTVKLDMPAHKSGIDVRADGDPAINFSEYAQRLKRFGIAVRRGEQVIVSKIKVKEKNIEFQLGGGGYGTAFDENDDSVFVSAPGKSQREKNLERDLKVERDPKKQRELKEQIDDLRKDRQREQARIDATVAAAEAYKRESIRTRALQGGSRFNLVFPNGVPERALTPEFLMDALADWVVFESDRAAAAPEMRLRKGITERELRSLYGEPVSRDSRKQGDLRVDVLTFQRSGETVVATLVEDVVVRYTVTAE
jgi:hypothetical protein